MVVKDKAGDALLAQIQRQPHPNGAAAYDHHRVPHRGAQILIRDLLIGIKLEGGLISNSNHRALPL